MKEEVVGHSAPFSKGLEVSSHFLARFPTGSVPMDELYHLCIHYTRYSNPPSTIFVQSSKALPLWLQKEQLKIVSWNAN